MIYFILPKIQAISFKNSGIYEIETYRTAKSESDSNLVYLVVFGLCVIEGILTDTNQ